MRTLLIAAGMLAATPASAEVLSASGNGFEIRHSANLVIPQARAYAAFGQISQWWSKDHSYSGDASRLSLQLRPGGCFCETLDGGGGVEHLRIAYLQPGERVVMTGSLGPLLYEGTSGAMDIQFEKIAGGTRIVMTYRVAGFARGNAATIAPAVDQVLGEQMRRLRIFAAGSGRR
ncbi:ATPase [Sphingomonas sp. LY160]|uniref:ATPase n=1 Tax=Sphingomonas sp. LY160 TaxID=3095342 RepID=UPI002ADEF41C|nr:ATPase [Sphingomonas sp. LY160]MEA1071813.1 ATPase [Sphingomonas sp. LY160]